MFTILGLILLGIGVVWSAFLIARRRTYEASAVFLVAVGVQIAVLLVALALGYEATEQARFVGYVVWVVALCYNAVRQRAARVSRSG